MSVGTAIRINQHELVGRVIEMQKLGE